MRTGNSRRIATAATSIGVILAGPPAAWAQTNAKEPSVDKYLCIYANKCDDAASQGDATMEAPDAKGFRVARAPGASSASTTTPSKTARSTATSTRYTARRTQPSSVGSAGSGRADLMIGFALGSDRMTADGLAKARVFAAALVRPELRDRRFLIEGHTDSRGDPSKNRDLSQRRAEAVAAYLASQGVDRSRLSVKGVGFDTPLPGRSASDPANRRVEAELVK
jgi:outer membrane protein OmpA-like peptidoglycan-associated protein